MARILANSATSRRWANLMSDLPNVFISATSRDLGSYRTSVRDALLTVNAHPLVQEHFPPDYRSVSDILRQKIADCHAVICLIGPVYGQEPRMRGPDDPRRSYTQLEHDIAVEFDKPVFAFFAADDCPLDHPPEEPEELRALQRDYKARLMALDRRRESFHSRDELVQRVNLLRFDPVALRGLSTNLAVVLDAQLVNVDRQHRERGAEAWVRDVAAPYHKLLQEVLERCRGTVQSEEKAGEECLVNFNSAADAARAALDLHEAVRRQDWHGPAPEVRIGVNMGQIFRFGGADQASMVQAGQTVRICRMLTSLALRGQTLFSRAAADDARQCAIEAPPGDNAPAGEPQWLAHGRYVFADDARESLDVFELGLPGRSPMQAPPGAPGVALSADSLEEAEMRGWRPSIGQALPNRTDWVIEAKLGEGGFGEVWLARNQRLKEARVFKFCFDADRLRSFKRELTIFQLLKDHLGSRDDIAKLLDVQVDAPPFYLESEYLASGDLARWCERQKGLAHIALETRLRLLAAAARAVAAAHSLGIIHKDLKPSNIFIVERDGVPHPRLADFGIGVLTDRRLLEQHNITETGFTETLALGNDLSRTGTRLYSPPETQIGKPATTAVDVYALGVMLYQLVAGDLTRPLGVGWEEEVADPLLREDIAACTHGDPARRLGTAAELAVRLEQLSERRAKRDASRRAAEAAERRRRMRIITAVTIAAIAVVVVGTLGLFSYSQWQRADTEREQAASATRYAEQQRDKAREEERKAKIAFASADDEQRKAGLARQREEYEAYVAQIGLAASKIDENAFGSARDLLQRCKPELRNWEWGRLMYLCGLSQRSVNGEAPLDAVAFSGDGSRFVTGGWNGKVQIWDTASRKLLKAIPYDGPFVFAVSFSPDGRYVAAGGSGSDAAGFIRLWDSQTGAPLQTAGGFDGHLEAVHSVTFSRDGKTLLTASHDRTAKLWDVESGKQLQSFVGYSSRVRSAAFSHNDKSIVTASEDGSVFIWDSGSGKRVAQFPGHKGPVFSAAFSPDDSRVVTGGFDSRVLVWRVADAEKVESGEVAAEKVGIETVPFRAFKGHGGPVRSVSFSGDGALVLSGSHDNTVKVWDAESGRALKTFRGHDGQVTSCAFSPDRKTIVSAGHDHRAVLWSVANYAEDRVLHGHDDAVLSASFNRNGRQIVTGSSDCSARIWDAANGDVLRTFEEGRNYSPRSAVFFPDGKRFLTAAGDHTVRIWDVAGGTQTARIDRTGRVAALAVSPDGKRVLTISDERTDLLQNPVTGTKLWDAGTGKLIKLLPGDGDAVTAVAFSADNTWLFTGDASGRGILWNASTLEEAHRLQSHTAKITAAAFLSDGTRLLTASNDKTVAQWDLSSGNELLPLVLKHPAAVLSLAAIPGMRRALTCSADQGVRVWDLDKAQVVGTLETSGMTNAVAVAPDGRRAITVSSEEGTVRLWELESRREIVAPRSKGPFGAFLYFDRSQEMLWFAAISPDGDLVVTVGSSGARLWDMQKGAERMSFSSNAIIASAGFSPDGSHIVTGSRDHSARIWDTATGLAVRRLECHAGDVNSAVYSPDGRLILTASDDRTAVVWNAQTAQVLRTLQGHNDRLRSAAFSPDGQRILTASNDKTARLWQTDTGEEVGRFQGHEWAVLSAVFSADGTMVLTGSEDNLAKIWDAETCTELMNLAGHTAPVTSVAFLPDGRRVLTGSQDNTAKLWDVRTGRELLTLNGHSQEVTCVSVSPDGHFLLTASRDGTSRILQAIPW